MKTKLLSMAIALGFNALASQNTKPLLFAYSLTSSNYILTNSSEYDVSKNVSYSSVSKSSNFKALTPLCVTPTLVITPATTNTICEGSSIILSVSGAASYTWDTGVTTASISLTPTVTTNYTVTGTNGLGCTTTKTVTVVVNPKPQLGFSLGMSSSCAGSNISLSVWGADTYTWSTNETGDYITVAPIVNTDYTVTGTDTLGCVESITFPINITPKPIITVTSATLCAGISATLTASGADSYYWVSSSSTVDTIIVSPTTTTEYMVYGQDASTECWSAAVSATVEVSICTGINELVNIEMALYPNPSDGILNISLSNNITNNCSIELYDAFGKLIVKQNLLSEVNTVNIKHLNIGLYLYKIIDNTGIIKNGKIIKE